MGAWDARDGIVAFPDDRRVRGGGLHTPHVGSDPEFGVSLTGRDPRVEGWPYRWVRWRGFRVPDSTADTVDALREAHHRSEHERVEVACGAGIGRTGTALSVLAIMSGIPVDDAVTWVRDQGTPRRQAPIGPATRAAWDQC